MGYYKMLLAIFVILVLSVIVQGTSLFLDPFFALAYVIMGTVLFIGTKYRPSSGTSFAMGLILILSVGFLSTDVLVRFFTEPVVMGTFFKLAIVFSLDACSLFFLHCGRKMRTEETGDHRFGQYKIDKEGK
jgi:FtsH-binding integral membrane protein